MGSLPSKDGTEKPVRSIRKIEEERKENERSTPLSRLTVSIHLSNSPSGRNKMAL